MVCRVFRKTKNFKTKSQDTSCSFEDEQSALMPELMSPTQKLNMFDGVTGLVLGDFSESDDEAVVAGLLHERLVPLGVPMVEHAGIGHQPLNLAVPLGVVVTLDAAAGTLTPLFPPFR